MQGIRTETKHIGGYDYTVSQLDAIEGRRAFTRLTRFVGPALVHVTGDAVDMAKLFADVAGRLAEDDVDYFCDLFAKRTAVSGGDLKAGAQPQLDTIFSLHFAGRYLELVEWLTFCFKVNFGPFFAGLGAKMGGVVRAVASA